MPLTEQKVSNNPIGSFPVYTDVIGDARAQVVKLDCGDVGLSSLVTASNPLPVTFSGGITGTVTANAGTNLNTSALALETGGNLDSISASLTALINNLIVYRQLLANIAQPGWVDPTLNRVKVSVALESSQTLATVTALTNIDSQQGRLNVIGSDMSAWCDCVRSRIS